MYKGVWGMNPVLMLFIKMKDGKSYFAPLLKIYQKDGCLTVSEMTEDKLYFKDMSICVTSNGEIGEDEYGVHTKYNQDILKHAKEKGWF
jgi:hypothetical protein